MFFGFAATARADSLTELAQSQEWLRILHYKSHLFRGFRSAIDDSDFFLAENGEKNPEAELRATVEAFRKPGLTWGKLKQPIACAFPARFRFLNERLKLGFKRPPCQLFDSYIERFSPRGATLVFSSAYPDNPASMFGHTFLRINKTNSKGDLLDHSLGYAAVIPPDENDFAFIWFGVTGGYPGQLGVVPYYTKVNEYSNSESRDLWEYELDLNADQTWWLVANAWEIETNGYLDYYFFDENCSWLMLRLLEVARPDWNLSDFAWDVIPGETVKRLARTPGAVRSVRFRPSLYKKMRQAVESLSSDSLERYKSVRNGRLAVNTVQDTGALNAVLARLYYEKQKDGLADDTNLLLRQTLLQRAAMGEREEIRLDPIPETTRPDLGHDSSRVGLAANDKIAELHWKSGYHDLFNSDLGFAAFSEINFPGMTMRYSKRERIFIVSQIEGLSILSLQPVTDAVTPLSWKARVAFERLKDLNCETCRGVRGEGGVGFSLVSRNEENAAWSLAGVRAEGSRHVDKGRRGLAFGELGAGKSWNRTQKTVATARYLPQIFGATNTERMFEGTLVHSVQFTPFWEMRGIAETTFAIEPHRSSNGEMKIQLNRYF